MGRRIRAFDWSKTSLGAFEKWPESLKTAIRICLGSRYPIVLWWGKTSLIQFYNDAYIPVIGPAKNPFGLGCTAQECWPEIWHIIGPMFQGIFATGEATWSEDLLLLLNRQMPLEECYFTFSYSPLPDDNGEISGVFCAVQETTGRVIGDRRMRTLRDLGRTSMTARTASEACSLAATTLKENAADITFSLIYLLGSETGQARLAASTGIEVGAEASPAEIEINNSKWPLTAALESPGAYLIDNLIGRFGPLPGGPWPEPTSQAVILPIPLPSQPRPAGFLIAGLSPRRVIDADYLSFFDLIAGHLSAAISNAHAYEEERRRATALAEIDRAKTAFFSNVSHEFRTPLTLMLGPLEDTLADPSLPPADRERLEMAHRNSLRLLKLVNSLLDFSRIEEGRTRATYRPTDLAPFTAELASNFRSACQRAGLKLLVDCQPLPEPVYVDRGMWEKIVLNLLSNAFKFTFEGEIAVRLRPCPGHVELSVSDTGVGIPHNELPRLFERFHRIEGQRSRSFEGSGIGLALVQELVRLHHGAIVAESEPGRGTTFTVRVPFGRAHLAQQQIDERTEAESVPVRAEAYIEEALNWLSGETPQTFEPEAFQPPAPNQRDRTRILLADDNADMRSYVRRLLGATCDVKTVNDGEEALEAITADRPDLLLADVMMPRRDGFSLLRAIRSDPRLSEIPVILLSARAGEESRVQGLEAGADDYLVKPFSARELTARVNSILELSRVRRNAFASVRDSERRIRGMFQQAPSFICILRGPDHVFEFANDAYMRTVGEHRKLIGKSVREGIPEAQGQGYFEFLDQVFQSGKPFHGTETPLRIRRTPDGPPVDIQLDFIYQPIADESGQVTGIFVEGFEVTQRVAAQAALRESEERYRTLFNSIDEGFCILEAVPATGDSPRDYRHLAVNPALEVQSGIATNVGDTTRQLLGDESQGWIDMFDEILRTGEPVRGERRLLAQGRVLDFYSFRLEDESNRRIGVIFTDVTVRKRAQAELLSANQALEQFAYSASHDLQEPLRSVKIYSELLARRLKGQLSPETEGFLDVVAAGAARMELLVRDLLSYTKSTLLDRPTERAEASEALSGALANLESSIRDSGAEVTSGPLPALRVHTTQLQQILQNLIGNAIKYRRPEVPPVIAISARRDNEFWLFSVKDNGIGIPPEYKERVFGLFKRLHTSQEYPGTGIGLAICQRIVERYHGRIWVESELDRGSTFCFTLPA